MNSSNQWCQYSKVMMVSFKLGIILERGDSCRGQELAIQVTAFGKTWLR